MRIRLILASLAVAGAASALAFLGCYSTGDLGDTPYACSPTYPECPDGYMCDLNPGRTLNKCVRVGGMMMGQNLTLPTMSSQYTGPHKDPGLSTMNACQSSDPNEGSGNNSIATATPANVFDDMMPHSPLAICPVGDIDVYAFTLDGTQHFRITATFATPMGIQYGDLGLAIYDGNGKLAMSGGNSLYDNEPTARQQRNGACVADTTPLMSGTWYAAVYGAKSTMNTDASDQNRYIFRIEKGTGKLPCSGGSMPDMGMGDMAPDLSF